MSTAPSWDDLHEIANGQSAHFTAKQAAEAGFSAQLLHKHVQSGNLTRPERGIYRITRFPPSENENLIVLWLWSGQEAVFSHETALQLHDLSDALPSRVHLTLPTAASRNRRKPEGTVLHYADLSPQDVQWLGAVPITTPARTVLDVATAHGDAGLVAQAIDQGIKTGRFGFEQVALAGSYVANAQGWGTPIRPHEVDGGGFGGAYGHGRADGSGSGFGGAYGHGRADGSGGLGEHFYARPISGTCAKRPPSDWPNLAAELAQEAGAHLRVAQYLPSRTMYLEFAWPIDRLPDEQAFKSLRRQLAKRFSWA